MFCLPCNLGGWALPLPQMNARIDISRQAQALLKIPYCSCDLYWPEHRVAIEYDSRQYHGNYNAQLSDAQRKVILENEGITIIPVHFEQLKSDAAFESIALRLYHLMGKRYRSNHVMHAKARARLRSELHETLGNPAVTGLPLSSRWFDNDS